MHYVILVVGITMLLHIQNQQIYAIIELFLGKAQPLCENILVYYHTSKTEFDMVNVLEPTYHGYHPPISIFIVVFMLNVCL